MSATIALAGVGQFGSRYLQGLAYCQRPLEIHVQDVSAQSLQTAKLRWEQASSSESSISHKVFFHSSLDKLPRHIDVAIVATNADARPQVVRKICNGHQVRYWVLEKVLAQSESALDELLRLTRNTEGTWVNTARRMMTWHQQIRNAISKGGPLTVRGGSLFWGLACNAIHHLDLVAWWTGETLLSIDNADLDPQWMPSKRPGFFEITGKLNALYSGGTRLTLESRPDGKPFTLEIEAKEGNWKVDELNGVATGPREVVISGQNELQSTLSSKLIDTLLWTGQCDLPTLPVSLELHRVLLRSLLGHWNRTHGTEVDELPIT